MPYRGSGDALVDLLAGSVQMMNEIVVYPHVKAGKLNLLAVNNPTRHWDFPDVPTMTEAGFPNADVPIWFSIWAPVGNVEGDHRDAQPKGRRNLEDAGDGGEAAGDQLHAGDRDARGAGGVLRSRLGGKQPW